VAREDSWELRDGRTASYCDGLPAEVAKFPDPYAGMEKLDFAKDAPDFREAIRELTK
jgi:hypothetical protein